MPRTRRRSKCSLGAGLTRRRPLLPSPAAHLPPCSAAASQPATTRIRQSAGRHSMASVVPEGGPAKRPKLNGGSWQHSVGPTYHVTGLQLTDHTIRVPLDHSGSLRS